MEKTLKPCTLVSFADLWSCLVDGAIPIEEFAWLAVAEFVTIGISFEPHAAGVAISTLSIGIHLGIVSLLFGNFHTKLVARLFRK